MTNFVESFKNSTRKTRKDLNRKLMYLRIKDKNFTIISNDCWGGEVYKDLGLEYTTPFVGIRLFAPCYIKLLKNIKEYIESPLTWTDVSRYNSVNQEREKRFFPIGLLRDDVEIHFFHEASEAQAQEKWNRRAKRINWDNLFIKFAGDKDLCNEQLIEEFDKLDFPHKICLTAKEYSQLKSTIFVKNYVINGATMYDISRKDFDVAGWLNKEGGQFSTVQRLINKLI